MLALIPELLRYCSPCSKNHTQTWGIIEFNTKFWNLSLQHQSFMLPSIKKTYVSTSTTSNISCCFKLIGFQEWIRFKFTLFLPKHLTKLDYFFLFTSFLLLFKAFLVLPIPYKSSIHVSRLLFYGHVENGIKPIFRLLKMILFTVIWFDNLV